MLGTIVNVGAVLAGTAVGWGLKLHMSVSLNQLLLQVLGVFTLLLGTQMYLSNIQGGATQSLLILGSLLGGAVLGEGLRLEARVQQFGQYLQRQVAQFGWVDQQFAKAFVTSSLLFCIGPMAILGAIQDGLSHDPSLLLVKAVMDGVVSIAFAATLGLGTAVSALPILIYQGGMTLLAQQAQGLMTPAVMATLTAVGGFMLACIGVNLLELLQIRVTNLLPALAIAAVGAMIWGAI